MSKFGQHNRAGLAGYAITKVDHFIPPDQIEMGCSWWMVVDDRYCGEAPSVVIGRSAYCQHHAEMLLARVNKTRTGKKLTSKRA